MGAAEVGHPHPCLLSRGHPQTSAPGSPSRSPRQPVPLPPGTETVENPLWTLRSEGVGRPGLPRARGRCVEGWCAREELLELGFGTEVSRGPRPGDCTRHLPVACLLRISQGCATYRQTSHVFPAERRRGPLTLLSGRAPERASVLSPCRGPRGGPACTGASAVSGGHAGPVQSPALRRTEVRSSERRVRIASIYTLSSNLCEYILQIFCRHLTSLNNKCSIHSEN